MALATLGLVIGQTVGILGGVTNALVLGMIFRNCFALPSIVNPGIHIAETSILSMAIVLIGLNLDISRIGQFEISTILFVIAATTVALGLAWWLGAWFGFDRKIRLLLGVGTAICGSSAIAACAPMITDDEREIGLSVAVVNLLGILGILILPLVAEYLGFDAFQGGLLVGSSLQAVGQVVAAGYSISDQAGELATVVKMGRVSLLMPLVLCLAFWSQKKSDGTVLPAYLWGFILFAVIGSMGILPDPMESGLKLLGKFTLAVAMTAIGLGIDCRQFSSGEARIMLYGAVVSCMHIAFILFSISIVT